MSFNNKGFTPVHVNAGGHAPRLFSYCNTEDLLDEIMEPGYFNDKKLIMRPNSFVKVICKNAVVELVVEKNTGDLTFKEEILRAVDPYKELKKPTRQRRTQAQINADKKKTTLAKTG